jgi:gliding motility-associated-like protein
MEFIVTGIRDFNGCEGTVFPANIIVEVGKADAFFTITSPNPQCSGSEFTFEWNADPDVAYTWTWPDGVAAPQPAAGLNGVTTIDREISVLNTSSQTKLPVVLSAQNTTYPTCPADLYIDYVNIFPAITPGMVIPADTVCSGAPININNITLASAGSTHTWTVTRIDGGPGVVMPPPLSRGPAFHTMEQFIIHNNEPGANNPEFYEIRYDIQNSAGFGNCQATIRDTVTVYREGIAKIGTPKDPAVPIPLWSAPSDVITFENATNPLDPGDFEYIWVFDNNNPSTPADTVPSSNASEPYTFVNPGIGKKAILYVINTDARDLGKLPGGCMTRDEFIFTINVGELTALFDTNKEAACLPTVIEVTNLSGGDFVSEWKVINSSGSEIHYSQEFEPDFPLTKPGQYTITLTVKNPFDAADEKVAPPRIVDVYANPVAAFNTSPLESVFVPDQELRTDNGSASARDPLTNAKFPIQYKWYFGDMTDTVATDPLNPAPTYGDEGHSPTHKYNIGGQSYEITLVAINDHGGGVVCKDTATATIKALIAGTTKIPNAFTPNPGGPSGGVVNEDGTTINDVFLPITKGVKEFQMQIFDRWGNLVFESDRKDKGWDGYDRNGNLVPAGVYVYKLVLRMSNDQRTTQVGDVTLIR